MAFLDQAKPASTSLNSARLALAAFSITLFISAFLLFSVQPFFAKMVLPKLGGAPAVWSVAMVFFQSMLLAGYLYAHVLATRLTTRTAMLVHVTVMAAALLVMPIAIPAGWGSPPETGQAIWLLGLFVVSVGLPFFAVAANGPLLQAWFSRSGHPSAADPYFLYGASNLGSFASLILFAALIEPFSTVPDQSKAWMMGFVVLGAGIAVCALLAGNAPAASQARTDTARPAELQATIGAATIAKWVALAFVPSGLLVAVTAHITTDIAAAPFLWIVPLALFLLTFIIAFAKKPMLTERWLAPMTLIAALAMLSVMILKTMVPVLVKLPIHLAGFFIAALYCHALLVKARPNAVHLTAFYLWMSVGGVLGGIFASLAAPVLFNQVVEYPLLIALACLCRPDLWAKGIGRTAIWVSGAVIAAVTIATPAVAELIILPQQVTIVMLCAIAVAVSLRNLGKAPIVGVLSVIVLGGVFFGMKNAERPLFTDRSFFGVVNVSVKGDGKFIAMTHGTTQHGVTAVDPATGVPEPLAYYHSTGALADTLFASQEKWAKSDAMHTVGVVGLGTGSMLCHRKANERWVSYEIDKTVVDAASNPKLFRFISECRNGDPIIIGDARLKLEEKADGTFSYLQIDAFSSDAIPVHLLTREAFALYFSKMTDDGILAIHISNRYLELESLLQAVAEDAGFVGRSRISTPSDADAKREVHKSHVVVLARNDAALGRLATDPNWQPLPDLGTRLWTDDYSNLIAAFLRMQKEATK
jgi:hypothetical protein